MPSPIVVAGGGPAAFEAILTLRELAPELDVQLLAPDPDLVYRPTSVVEPFARAGVRCYPIESLGVPVHRGRLARVDVGARVAVADDGARLSYDALLVATGVAHGAPVPKAITFTGPHDVEAMHGLVQDIEQEYSRDVAFFAPPETGWTLPLYELALQTAERASEMELPDLRLRLVTHEARPLEALGTAASDLASVLLEEAGIAFETAAEPPEADRLVCLGTPEPPAIPGLPEGFLVTDEHGAVTGAPGVWAAGDVADHPIKQGGLATQQAAVAATAIAADLGAPVAPQLSAPVLRAMLIAGRRACYFRRRLDGVDPGQASRRALWWPPTKIAGERLAPFLDALDAETGTTGVERKLAGDRVKRRAVISSETRGPLG